jgi:predicted PurR-regulated permease PerM
MGVKASPILPELLKPFQNLLKRGAPLHVGTALIQGALAAIGFLIAGVPNVLLLGLLTFVLCIVPLGAPLIFIPAIIWLVHGGESGWAIFLSIWGLGVSTVDNFIKPVLISQGSDMPFLLVLFGALGGLAVFGFIGLFIGPTLLAVAYNLVDEWLSEKRNNSPEPEPEPEPA